MSAPLSVYGPLKFNGKTKADKKDDHSDKAMADYACESFTIGEHEGGGGAEMDAHKTTFDCRGACGAALERGGRIIIADIEQSPIFAGTGRSKRSAGPAPPRIASIAMTSVKRRVGARLA
jgi:hypothetical protein